MIDQELKNYIKEISDKLYLKCLAENSEISEEDLIHGLEFFFRTGSKQINHVKIEKSHIYLWDEENNQCSIRAQKDIDREVEIFRVQAADPKNHQKIVPGPGSTLKCENCGAISSDGYLWRHGNAFRNGYCWCGYGPM